MAQADIISSKYNKVDCLKAAIKLFYAGGNYEEVINHETGKTKSYHYIHGGSGLAAVYIAEEDSAETDNLYYIHKDYLGSILALTNQEGSAVECYSFDAWGHRRNPTNWSQWQEDSTNYIVNRGFTGHEHMDIFGLINMNGRVYDPDLGRFISPDPYVQMPGNSQNFNRYSYALNNPLKYTDPSGYNIREHPRYDSWEKNITGAGRGFMRAFNQYGYMSSDQLGTPQLAYGYDWSTGTYRNNEGGVASWYDVKNNYIMPNATTLYSTNTSEIDVDAFKALASSGTYAYLKALSVARGEQVNVGFSDGSGIYIATQNGLNPYLRVLSPVEGWGGSEGGKTEGGFRNFWNNHWASKIIPDVIYINTSIGLNLIGGTGDPGSLTTGYALPIRGKNAFNLYAYFQSSRQEGLHGGISINVGYATYLGSDTRNFDFEKLFGGSSQGWEDDLFIGIGHSVSKRGNYGGKLYNWDIGIGPALGGSYNMNNTYLIPIW